MDSVAGVAAVFAVLDRFGVEDLSAF